MYIPYVFIDIYYVHESENCCLHDNGNLTSRSGIMVSESEY